MRPAITAFGRVAAGRHVSSQRATDPDAPMDDVNPFRGNFGSEDSGQTNDGPLVEEGKLLSGHASSRDR